MRRSSPVAGARRGSAKQATEWRMEGTCESQLVVCSSSMYDQNVETTLTVRLRRFIMDANHAQFHLRSRESVWVRPSWRTASPSCGARRPVEVTRNRFDLRRGEVEGRHERSRLYALRVSVPGVF